MRRNDARRATWFALACLLAPPSARAASEPNEGALEQFANRWTEQRAASRGTVFERLQRSSDPLVARLRADAGLSLQWIDARGVPRYYTLDNLIAARTIATDDVHPGGSAGLALDGSATPAGRLGVWDGGAVRTTHSEFGGRVLQIDAAAFSNPHSTHVAGTMAASGVDPNSIGMSPAAPLHCYEWTDDGAEMALAAANGMRVSNHSYSPSAGWRMSFGQWYWHGDVSISATEDYGFGFYGTEAQAWDQIAFDAPGYLIVASAGNNRAESGPGPGGDHAIWDGTMWVPSTDTRQPDGGTTGYDTIPWTKTAKNVLVVGAVGDLAGGYSGPGGVMMTTFSGFGPTDDGRIKPDLVSNGVSVWSSTDGNDTAHGSMTGTSQAAPNVASSVNLLVDHWIATHGGTGPRAATLKSILVQTADECGNTDGPDYRFGWGLMNTAAAAALISEDAAATTGAHVWESELIESATDSYLLDLESPATVRFTLAWTDPAAVPVAAALDPVDTRLVNDLDITLSDGSSLWQPWVLDPTDPTLPAIPGKNFRDNAEQILAVALPAGRYTVAVSHTGALEGAVQAYALVGSHALVPHSVLTTVPPRSRDDAALGASPNPFRSSTTLSFRVAERSNVDLSIFDLSGRLVQRITSGTIREPGLHRVDWNGRGADGALVPSGVYFARLTSGPATTSVKIVLVRPH